MSAERIDPELLAAFLDGTASLEEREAVMRTLAASNDAYREFIGAAAIKRDLDAGDASKPVGTTASDDAVPKRRPFRSFMGPLLLAAGVAGVIVLGRLVQSRPAGSIQLAQATRVAGASGSGSLSRTLGQTWDQPLWSTTRGGGMPIAAHPRAFRAGVLYADLEAAANATDSSAVVRTSESLVDLLSSVEAGAPLATRIRAVARASHFGGQPERAAVARQLRALLGADVWFDLGVWTETARLAIAERDVAFFQPGSDGLAEARRILGSTVSPADRMEWTAVVDPLRPFVTEGIRSVDDLASLDRAVRNAIVMAAR